ncbi:MAG TPA: peptidoglycan bridge formation glycyltransferase FemA/FemB family protein [Candidatus Limnocylindria bacterium]|jgi:lipid II:glycine glycyltransferase (peptidoglycan interpeptide bridge formation enzyme)|nr:peptidoglycan bridge formation glycyltransferase FemA/FemB family protein [Candidatus Limnocylindria bacterium]
MPELAVFRVTDRDTWNAFVERAPYRSFPQLWEWGELRETAGWRPIRLAVGERPDQPLAGAQVLVRQVPLVGWRLGYAPRGPIGQLDDEAIRRALIAALRDLATQEGIATLKVDPEATAGDPLGRALLAAPWRRATRVQPPRTRLIELAPDEEALLGAMSKKHRQYVHKAEREGVTVTQLSPSAPPDETAVALADFYRIYADTAERAGFAARVQDYYERVWSLFAPAGHARLFFAVLGGERVATLFHFSCGDRAAEAYGGMTDAGADSHANYLLKWDAIRAFRTDGFTSYDLWGIATGGIAHFKEGFGGRQVDYVGARDLPLRATQDAALRVLLPAYGIVQRARLRLTGHKLSGSDD